MSVMIRLAALCLILMICYPCLAKKHPRAEQPTQQSATPDWIVTLFSQPAGADIGIPQNGGGARLHVYTQSRADQPHQGLTFVWLSMPKNAVEIIVDPAAVEGNIVQEYERSASPQDIAITTGGFFSSYNTCGAEGLVISNGRKVSEVDNKKFGGFLLSRGVGAVKIESVHDPVPAGVRNAIQGTPILVREHNVDNIGPTLGGSSNRLGVGSREWRHNRGRGIRG